MNIRPKTPPYVRGTGDTSTSIEWYAEGEARVVGIAGLQVVVRLVGRKGRRARIAITAPAGAVFCSSNSGHNASLPEIHQSD